MSITAVLSLNESKARQITAGSLRVFLSERVPGNGTKEKDASPAPQELQNRKQKSKSNPSVVNYESCVRIVSDDEIEEAIVDSIENTSTHEQVMLLMLQQLNNAFRERLAGVKRAVFNTVVQRSLASNAPRTMEEVFQLTISGISVTMKKKYGKYLIQAVAQVDAFIEMHSRSLDTMVDSFELDVDAILGPKIMTAAEVQQTQKTPIRRGCLDWGESDDDWEIMPSENPDNGPPTQQDESWNHVLRPNQF